MENLEALVLDLLISVSLDVSFQGLEGGLVGLDWVAQIVFSDRFLVVSQEATNCLDAGCRLEILAIYKLVQLFFNLKSSRKFFETKVLHDSHESALESLEVPVLVNDLVDDSSLEHLHSLVGEEVDKVVHGVQFFMVIHVLSAPLGQELLTDHEHKVSEL
jgi:hypothetical protein